MDEHPFEVGLCPQAFDPTLRQCNGHGECKEFAAGPGVGFTLRLRLLQVVYLGISWDLRYCVGCCERSLQDSPFARRCQLHTTYETFMQSTQMQVSLADVSGCMSSNRDLPHLGSFGVPDDENISNIFITQIYALRPFVSMLSHHACLPPSCAVRHWLDGSRVPNRAQIAAPLVYQCRVVLCCPGAMRFLKFLNCRSLQFPTQNIDSFALIRFELRT